MVSRSLVLVLVVGLASVTLGGCARTHLFYDTRELRHEPLEKKSKAALAQQVAGQVKGRTVTWTNAEGESRVIPSDARGLSKLPLAELGALWLSTSVGERGGESDIRVQVKKRGAVPVSVLVDLEGNIHLISSAVDRADGTGPTPTLDEIRSRYGLKKKMSGKWSVRERRALDNGLALLTPAELERVRAVRFERQKVSPDGDVMRGAFFEMKGCDAVIFLYSSGVDADRYRFTGDAAEPKSAILHSLLHEIGHAVEQSAARDRFCAAEKAKGARRNKLIEEGNGMVRNSPALAAYLRTLGDRPAPTDYGNSSGAESFAESFALAHVDPKALERTRPEVQRWFLDGGHMQALGER